MVLNGGILTDDFWKNERDIKMETFLTHSIKVLVLCSKLCCPTLLTMILFSVSQILEDM